MPIYDFVCPSCGNEKIDLFQYLDDPCPICDGKTDSNKIGHDPCVMKKIISKTSFQLKGDGWARDNYKGKL